MSEYFTRDHLGRLIRVEAVPVPAASTPPPVPQPPPEPAPEPEDRDIILGTDSTGKPVSLEDFRKREFSWDSIVTLTSLGARAKAAFSEIRLDQLRARAQALGIDHARIEAWARTAGWDPAATLKAEIELREIIARDRTAASGGVRPW